jgi:glutaredoxin-like protein NrdH
MRITIYTRNNCVQCHATKRAIESRGLAFDLINLDNNPDAIDDLRARGFRQLPVVVTEQESWSGFRPDMINRLRDRTPA